MVLKVFQGKKKFQINRHFVFIEAPVDIVAPEAVLWGEATWWPKACAMKFKRVSEGELGVGTKFVMKVQKPFGPKWNAEITRLDERKLIERTFLNGIFTGFEIIRIGERANGTRIDYELHFRLRGLFNKLLWPLFYRKEHDKNIKLILTALRDHVIGTYQKLQEKGREEA